MVTLDRGLTVALALSTLVACSSAGGSGGASTLDGNTGGSVSSSGGAPGSAGLTGAGGSGSPGAGGIVSSGGGGNAGGTTGGTTGAGGVVSASGGSGGAALPPPDLSHTFDPITITANSEIPQTCQSWTLNNDQPLNVNTVISTNLGKFHHSNWIWVPDTLYTGPDGTWNCSDRGFDQIIAGAAGGVFFAQSTQATADKQSFPAGVAFQVPAHIRIIGNVHLLNTSDTDATTSLTLNVYTLPTADVKTQLQPMAYTNLSLDIAPGTTTHAHMQCATPQPDFDIYYILPHYHILGTGMEITVAGGGMDGTRIFQSSMGYGESVGQMFDPPIHVTGALGLGITCDYQSDRTSTVHYGEGDQEMCVSLIYSTGKKAGGETIGAPTITDVSGAHDTDSVCIAVGSP